MRLFRLGTLLLAVTLAVQAATSEQPLGQNLSYRRVREIPTDLPKTSGSPKKALVLDLRFARAVENEAAVFATWLKSYARPQLPVFVLVNDQTDPALLAPLASAEKPAGVVSIGPAREGANWDIPVRVSPEADRVAYDLLERGTPVEQLIARKMEKIRHDEASVAKNWPNGSPGDKGAEEPSAMEPATRPEGKSPAAAEPPVDVVLQRAIQLHRALLALRKIPSG